ncbi:MAG: hypothetical protein M1816_001914 [Peltula sp. TS41687]|nr:MAG: hypothetical protein M1816_001914 [Peltula sp. TS41687]
MAWSTTVQRWATALMGPSITAILIGTIVATTLPLLLHYFIYRSNAKTGLPAFLLVGPSGSGKTALLTQLERGQHASTHTSQAPLIVEASLPATDTTSSKYRSVNDPTLQAEKRFLLIDTPGHAKLRHYAFEQVSRPENLKGIIFMVDATSLSEVAEHEDPAAIGLRETAEYLYEIMLLLQRRSMKVKSSRAVKELPVLVAANKLDLFTALPTPLVRTRLEAEITRIRESRSKGLLDSGIDAGGDGGDVDEDKDWLGERDDNKFSFSQMFEMSVPVEVAGGHAAGPEGADVKQWRNWIGNLL